MPLIFEENRGQESRETLFLGHFGRVLAKFRLNEVQLASSDEKEGSASRSRIQLADANSTPAVRGIDRLQGHTNYYPSQDSAKWLTGVPHYGGVIYEQVYPGIDWVWYTKAGHVEYDFRVAPGADPRQVMLRFEDDQRLRLEANGDLVIESQGRELRHLRPAVYQEQDGERQGVAGDYVLLAENQVGFALGKYDPGRELVIDPVLSYSAYFGTPFLEESPAVTVDSTGATYLVARRTFSVTAIKIVPDGSSMAYMTVIGNGEPGCRSAAAVDSQGALYLTGTTNGGYPTTAGAYDRSTNGGNDLFATKLDASGAIAYSSVIGGSGAEASPCIALGPDGDVYIAAHTDSTDFPTTDGAYDRTFDSLIDLTVLRLHMGAQGAADLRYSTYVGGECNDRTPQIAVDGDGMIYVGAQTGLPPTFPTTPGAYDPTHNGDFDLVLFKLNPAGQGAQDLLYSTYFGGTGHEARADIALDPAGYVYLSGETDGAIPATAGAYDTTPGGNDDIFIAKFQLNSQGVGDLVFSTYVGGSGYDEGSGIFVDDAGLIYFVDDTDSAPYPLANALQGNFAGGGSDAAYGVLSPDGTQLLSSSYLGGSGFDCCVSLAVDKMGGLTIAGETSSNNFPTTAGAFNTTYGDGSGDVFISRIGQLNVRLVTISNATNLRPEFAPETIASGFGVGLASQTDTATTVPLPTTLSGVVVRVIDSNGFPRDAPLFFVSEFQVNYLVPAGTALGWARVEMLRDGQIVARDGLTVTDISPGIYTANGTGLGAPAANFVLVKADTSQVEGPVFDKEAPLGQRMTLPLNMGAPGDQLFVTFFATGTRGAAAVTATVDGTAVAATTPFVLKDYVGLEQINLGPLPRSLIGKGEVDVRFSFDGAAANVVRLRFQ